MATTQHYMWALGHFILLISATRYLLAWVLFRGPSAWWYKASFTGALVSYAIVCQKSLGPVQPTPTWLKRALVDENVQYFLLAFLWWSSKPIAVALLPFAIFSLFHALTFSRTTLLPQLLPPTPPANAGGQPTPHPLAKKVQVWVKSNYTPAMKAVAFIEVLIMFRVLLGSLTFRNSFLTPLFYAHFLRQRYFQSEFTRNVFGIINTRVEGYVRKEGAPVALVKGWDNFKLVLSKWAGSTLAPPQPAAAAAPQ